MSPGAVPLLGRLAADRACRRWITSAIRDLSRVDDGRALAVGPGAASFAALLGRRYEYVLAAGGVAGELTVVPGGRVRDGRRGPAAPAGWPTVRVDRRALLEVAPEIDGRFDLVLAIDAIRRLDVDDFVLPHLGWLLAPGGRLFAVDPVEAAEWAAVSRRYGALLPGARVDEVQPEVMGVRWEMLPGRGTVRLVRP